MFQLLSHPFPPSAEQADFFEWVATGAGSAELVSVAGSGKSTTVTESWLYIPEGQTVQAFAFNKAIADELNVKLQELRTRTGRRFAGWRCSTFHSIGLSAVLKRLGLRHDQFRADPGKLRKLARDKLNTGADYEMYGDFIVKLVGLAKGEGIGALVPNEDAAWERLIAHHDLYLESEGATEEQAITFARRLLGWSNEAAKAGNLDYDDMLYLVCLWDLKLWQNDWVFVDEAQDTNPVRRDIGRRALKRNGRFVGVGDPHQSIYGFTGASHDAMELVKKQFGCQTFRLSVSYRCSQAAARRAQQHVPYFQAAPNAPEGADLSLPILDALKILGDHDAILCRQTAPLILLAYALIAHGRPVKVLGREIGDNLINLVKKMKAKGIGALEVKLRQYRDREAAKFLALDQEEKAEAVTDRVDCLFTIINALPEDSRTIPALIAQIEGLFSDTNGCLMLATIHRVKGKEYGNVAILRPELSPSKWARQDHQYQQELNLMYVRDTRTKGAIIELTDVSYAERRAA